jgi:hygromycin-B 4-O-kinase
MERTESTHKTNIDQSIIQSFVEQSLSSAAHDFEFIAGGESSQAFAFKVGEESFVFRANNSDNESYKKDLYAHEHFGLNGIPIPEVIQTGVMNNGYSFAISKKIPGKTINHLSDNEKVSLGPELLSTLDSIHDVDISNTKGYGKWDSEGTGQQESWKQTLLAVDQYVHSDSDGPSLFETTFLEKNVWDQAHEKFKELLIFCPEDRYLVHADYGGDNVLSNEGKITGVLDWGTSMYGDFLYDIAWLDLWSKDGNYAESYKDSHAAVAIPNFNERVLCYKLYIILNSMSFFAYSNQQGKYDDIKTKLDALIK